MIYKYDGFGLRAIQSIETIIQLAPAVHFHADDEILTARSGNFVRAHIIHSFTTKHRDKDAMS